ncbi:MAG: GNAT family N-acetyltransferase, partial [Pseudomonas sp.]
MEAAEILVLQASYSNSVHAEAIGLLLNHYAQDP